MARPSRSSVARGHDALRSIQLLRVDDCVLSQAGAMQLAQLRSLAAIHLPSARQLGAAVKQIVTYDERMAPAAENARLVCRLTELACTAGSMRQAARKP